MRKKLLRILPAALLAVTWLVSIGCDETTGPGSSAAFEVLSEGDLTVKFRNLSVGACCYRWDFGDLSSPTFQDEPIHSYAMAGDYVVVLTACPQDDFSKPNCSQASAVVTVTSGSASIGI